MVPGRAPTFIGSVDCSGSQPVARQWPGGRFCLYGSDHSRKSGPDDHANNAPVRRAVANGAAAWALTPPTGPRGRTDMSATQQRKKRHLVAARAAADAIDSPLATFSSDLLTPEEERE